MKYNVCDNDEHGVLYITGSTCVPERVMGIFSLTFDNIRL
jgi:hypothetical protein